MNNIKEEKPVELVLVAPKGGIPLGYFKNSWLKDIYEDLKDAPYNKVVFKLEDWLNSAFFMERPKAEENPDFKQFIPYCVLKQNNKFFCYKRTKKGGEKRLHELYSCGVGGHVNPVDGNIGQSKREFYYKGLARELEEEVGLQEENYTQKILGSIYDNSNAVGQVHLGIVHLIELKPDVEIKTTDHALSNGGFETLKMMKDNKDMFENWSKIIIDNGVLDG